MRQLDILRTKTIMYSIPYWWLFISASATGEWNGATISMWMRGSRSSLSPSQVRTLDSKKMQEKDLKQFAMRTAFCLYRAGWWPASLVSVLLAHTSCKIDLVEALPLLSIDSFLNTFSELLAVWDAGTFSFDVLNALDPLAKPHMSVLA